MIRLITLTILLTIPYTATGQVIQGIILDTTTGQPVAGVNVAIMDTEEGTYSDEKGHFFIQTMQPFPLRINITHIGYEAQVITMNTDSSITVNLTPRIIKGRVVDVLGERPKYESDVASAVDIVAMEAVEIQGARDVGSALRRLSSVDIGYASSGKQTISIRGTNPSDVLVYLDGVRLNDSRTGVADLSAIDIQTLDQIQVIKGGNSILYGAGAIGGVVNLESGIPEENEIYYSQSIGRTFEEDLDLSVGATGVLGPLALGGKYTGQSRAYGGRTLTTSIFRNLFAGIVLGEGDFNLNTYALEKTLKFPSGGVTADDGVNLGSLRYKGPILGTRHWEFLLARREWSQSQDFLTTLNESLGDGITNIQVSKSFQGNIFGGTLQYGDENNTFTGDKSFYTIDSLLTETVATRMNRETRTAALVLRGTVVGEHSLLDKISWEFGFQLNRFTTGTDERNQIIEPEWLPDSLIPYSIKTDEDITLYSNRLGMHLEGHGPRFRYSVFMNQGNSSRLPALSDIFGRIRSGRDTLELEPLTPEYLTTAEIHIQVTYTGTQDPLGDLEGGVDLFINDYSNKIAYLYPENLPPLPYNAHLEDIRGFEAWMLLPLIKDRLTLTASGTWLDASDPNLFPNTPRYRYILAAEFHQDWVFISLDNLWEGKRFSYVPGIGEVRIDPRSDANLNITLRKEFLGLTWSLAYTWRNLASREESDLSLEESLRKGFNYFEKYREIFMLKVEI